MILVDSSVWIDYFRGVLTPQTEMLDQLMGSEMLATGDLILTEVLQGFKKQSDFDAALGLLTSFDVLELGGPQVSIQAARNYLALRRRGVTVRKTIDTMIATRCILSGLELLHNDRDFDPFVTYLGLRVVIN